MATLTTQIANITTGLVPTYAGAAGGGDSFTPDKDTFLFFKNSNAATRTITVITPQTVRGLAIADPSWTIAATTGELVVGPFPADLFGDPADGLADITYSAAGGVSVAVIKVQEI